MVCFSYSLGSPAQDGTALSELGLSTSVVNQDFPIGNLNGGIVSAKVPLPT